MISIVVPLLNEQDSLVELHQQIETSIREHSIGPYEVIFVDDGSHDESWPTVEQIANSNDHVVGIRLRRNFGKAAALSAGFQVAKGDYILTMDADLQDDPNEIVRLIATLESGYDIVSGWKQRRFDPWHKTGPSRIFNEVLRRFSRLNLHDFNCGLKIYRREVIAELSLYGEMHRFIPVFAAARGFRVTEIAVHHRPRVHGSSKYGFSRNIKGFLDLISVVLLTRYRHRPMHLFGSCALIASALSLASFGLSVFVSMIGWLMKSESTSAWFWCFASVVGLIATTQLLCTGLLAELIVARFNEKPEGCSSSYSVAQVIGPRFESSSS